MRAELGLPSVKGDDEHGGGMTGGFGGSMGGVRGEGKARRPINVKFEIPYFTTSGIQVRYLKIIEPKVSFLPYLLKARADQPTSCNIHLCRGSGISPSQEISLSGSQMRNDDRDGSAQNDQSHLPCHNFPSSAQPCASGVDDLSRVFSQSQMHVPHAPVIGAMPDQEEQITAIMDDTEGKYEKTQTI